jgi:hypothetical protein
MGENAAGSFHKPSCVECVAANVIVKADITPEHSRNERLQSMQGFDRYQSQLIVSRLNIGNP